MSESRSTVWCTNCARQFVAVLDLSLNGNHEITCPHCRHVHYRVVLDGVVTEERWRSSAGPIYYAGTSTTINVSMSFNATTNSLSTLWLNRSDLDLTTS